MTKLYSKFKQILHYKHYAPIANPRLIMTILAKNEEDIIERQILFNKAQGVDAFIVTDNNSSDKTLEIFRKYKDKGWILDIIEEKGENHDQSAWVHRMIILAKEKYNADWIINADADEFWYAKSGNLKNELSITARNKIFIPSYNMLPEDDSDYINFSNKIIKTFPKKTEALLERQSKLSKYSQFLKTIPKVIHRAKDYTMILEGNHDVLMKGFSFRHISKDISICHFNIRNRQHFKRKMIDGAKAVEKNLKLGKEIACHWRYFYTGYINNTLDLDTEYDKAVGKFCKDEIKKYNILEKDTKVKDFFEKTA
ncbi:MAG: glycosyltransferase family 2 protein [Endomicrobia bacterium]|nr:glycosyltransferase family 2 protein [Endomicrobiia bacterium]